MQDVQNIPNPDTNTNQENEEFGSHSDLNPDTKEGDIESPETGGDVSDQTPDNNNFPLEENPAERNSESDLL